MIVFKRGINLGRLELSVPGEHNKLNALAAIATGEELGLAFPKIIEGIAGFKGVDRRFQIIGEQNDVLVVDDYAHHPTEVKATLQAAREYILREMKQTGIARRLVAVFQPHQPGRLRDFWDEFSTSLADSDLALITDIYVARGKPIPGIDSRRFAACIAHENVHYLPGRVTELPARIMEYIRPYDLILTIGAGDITNLGPDLLTALKKSNPHGSGN
jgi:UDP-N-acetylmuramate--alanine ligase